MARSDVCAAAVVLASAVACGGSHATDATQTSAVAPPGDAGAPVAPASPRDAGATPATTARSCPSGDTRCAGGDCCASLVVPGGRFDQFDDPSYPATVSTFALDAFEVTASRFRAWVDATNGDLRSSAPAAGDGANPKIPGSGWRDEWTALLPSSRDEVDRMLGPERCQVGANLDDYGAVTWWTPEVEARGAGTREALDAKPLVCVPWHVLFAFCVWDGGRLPTNAEWGFAAAGGDEQRELPWGAMSDADVARIGERGDLSIAPRFDAGESLVVASLWNDAIGPNVFPSAAYAFTFGPQSASRHDGAIHIAPVGSRPAGRGRWGHWDLAGNAYEWMLDEGPIRPGPCNDCANVSWPATSERDPAIPSPFPLPDFEDRWFVGGARAIRGGAWDNALGLTNRQTAYEIATYTSYPLLRTYRSLGGRCARDVR